MKKFLATIFAVLTLVFALQLPLVSFAASSASVGAVKSLTITTDGKAKQLTLQWKKAKNAKAYQIYRSTTGKENSYQKIATTKDCTYTDTGLKSSTAYYYAVRGYAKQNGKTVYGSFRYADLSTRITKSFAQKKLQKAYQVAAYWMDPQLLNCDHSVTIPAPKNNYYVECYHPVTDKKIQTKEQLKAYLCKYFEWAVVEEFVEMAYMEKGGKLYMGEIGYGDGAAHYSEKDRVEYIWQKDAYATLYVIEAHESGLGMFEIPYPHGLYYEDGRWVFGPDDGIRSYSRVNYWNYLHTYDLNLG